MAVSLQNHGIGSHHLAVAPNLSALSYARRWLADLLAGSGLCRERIFDAQVVASEATANAIEHSASPVDIEVWTLPDRVILEVTNSGLFQPGLYKDEDSRRRGLGIPLMVSLADQLHVSRVSTGGTRVTATFLLRQGRDTAGAPTRCSMSAPPNVFEVPGPPVSVWALLPIAVITLIALAVAGLSGVYERPGIMAVLDVFCLTIPMLFAAVLAMRDYLAGRALAVLLVGASSLTVGAGALLAAVNAGGSGSGSKFVVYSTAALLGGMGFLGAAVLSRLTSSDGLSRRSRLVIASLSYLALVLLLVLVSQLTRTLTWPAYFVQGSGLTTAGMVIIRLAALMFVMGAAAMALLPGRRDLGLRRWYAVGLGLLAVGLASWSFQMTMGDALNWMGRGSQYLGSLVILGGLVLTARTTGGWSLPLERDLQESRERYEALARLSLDGIVVLEEGKVGFANDAAAAMFGSPSVEELMGREIHSLVHPEDHDAFEEMLEGSARGEMASPVRARLTGAGDDVTDVLITGTEASFRGTRPLQLVLHDVTGVERLTLALRDSEDRLALALEAVHCGTWELDLSSMTLQRDLGFDAILGLEALAPDWTNQQFLDRILPEDRDMVAKAFTQTIGARGELAVECRITRKEGSVNWVRLAGRCRPDSRGRWRLTGVVQEITSVKECEAALEKSVGAIQAAAEENDRLRRRELVATDAVQTSLLHVPSTIGPLRLSHLYRSATDQADAGGDFFDAFRLANDRVVFLIGDVAGHGVDATRAATLTKNLIHAYAQQITRPEQILYRANGFLVDTALPGFITLFLGILDLRTMQLRYSSAGHPEGMLRRAKGSVESLSSGSAPLAVYPEVSWMQWSVQLEDGDLLFLYTDGVTEARRDGVLFGEDRLQDLVRRKGANAQLLPGLVLDNILAFSADRLQDDVAVLAVEIAEEAGDFEEAS